MAKALRPQGHTPASVFRMRCDKAWGLRGLRGEDYTHLSCHCPALPRDPVVTNELASTRLDGPPLSSSQRDFVRSAAARCSRSSRGSHDAVRGQLVGCVWLDEACEARSSSPETNFCRYARNMS